MSLLMVVHQRMGSVHIPPLRSSTAGTAWYRGLAERYRRSMGQGIFLRRWPQQRPYAYLSSNSGRNGVFRSPLRTKATGNALILLYFKPYLLRMGPRGRHTLQGYPIDESSRSRLPALPTAMVRETKGSQSCCQSIHLYMECVSRFCWRGLLVFPCLAGSLVEPESLALLESDDGR